MFTSTLLENEGRIWGKIIQPEIELAKFLAIHIFQLLETCLHRYHCKWYIEDIS